MPYNHANYIHCFIIENGSAEFEKFINLIGDKIRLKGWKRYRGGLDTSCKLFIFYFFIILPLLKAVKYTVKTNRTNASLNHFTMFIIFKKQKH